MRIQKTLFVGLLSLLVISTMLANLALAQSVAPKSDATKVKAPSATSASAEESLLAPTCICPLVLLFDHGTYSTYYAIRCCDGQPVMIDAPSGLQTSNCTTCLPDCVQGTCRVLPHRDNAMETHFVMPDLAKKGVKSLTESVILPRANVEQLGKSFVVRFLRPDTGEQVFAKLFLFRANQNFIAATGHEVESTPNVPLIKADHVRNNVGDCCFLLKVGSVEYQIITFEKSQASSGKSEFVLNQQ